MPHTHTRPFKPSRVRFRVARHRDRFSAAIRRELATTLSQSGHKVPSTRIAVPLVKDGGSRPSRENGAAENKSSDDLPSYPNPTEDPLLEYQAQRCQDAGHKTARTCSGAARQSQGCQDVGALWVPPLNSD